MNSLEKHNLTEALELVKEAIEEIEDIKNRNCNNCRKWDKDKAYLPDYGKCMNARASGVYLQETRLYSPFFLDI